MSSLIWNTFAPLETTTSRKGVTIAGGTFRYVIDRKNGLIRSIRIGNREWLQRGKFCPDLWTSDEIFPRRVAFEAGRETRARVDVVRATAEKVVVRAQGRYRDRKGHAFPMEYRIEYAIDVDGMVTTDVENRATGPGSLRWLVFSKATMPANLVEFVNHSEDLARVEARTGGYESQPVPRGDGTILSGTFYPWLQFGNDTAGLDLTVDSADEIAAGATDSMPYRDPLSMEGGPGSSSPEPGATCGVGKSGAGVTWEYFAIRNIHTPVRSGWRRRNRFYLGVVPAKDVDPAFGDIRVNWIGPHQLNPNFVYPTDEEIATMSQQGINLLLGCAHWASGHYAKPLEPSETRRVIKACHRNGMKVIPYITFTDLNHKAPVYARHGEEWQIEPVAEFRHLTNLMCYGAEGWREYWKKDVDTIFDRFDFDGLYIDFWVGKMACTNPKHGCDHRYGRYTLPGVRDMAMHAFQRVKSKSPDHFILSNTNMTAGAMINNLVDIRLPGEWGNIEDTPDTVVRGYLNSRRLGCNSLLLTGQVPHLGFRTISLMLRTQSSMTGWRRRRKSEQAFYMKYADILRSFGIGRSTTLGAWDDDGSLAGDPDSMVTYWHRNERGCLVVGVDTEGKNGVRAVRVRKPQKLGIRSGGRYLLYRPDAGKLMEKGPVAAGKVRRLAARLQEWEPLLVFVTPAKERPQVVWATLSDQIEEKWSRRSSRLTMRISSSEGARSEVTVFADGRRVSNVTCAGRTVSHTTKQGLVRFKARCNEPVVVTFRE